MTQKPNIRHQDRIARVCDYINQNLNSPLAPAELSGVAGLSKYHFHRVFCAHTDMSVTRFIVLARLKRASYRLAFQQEMRILDIALEASFESPEAFARAFKRTFKQSPSEFRAQPKWPQWHTRINSSRQLSGDKTMNVKIVDFETTKIAFLEHLGPPENVLETAGRFIAWRKDTGLSPVASSKTFGIPYSDPSLTEPDSFRWDVCGSIDEDVPPNPYGVKNGYIPGGRCAVIRHHGSHNTLENSIYHVYRDWLPQTGEELRDFPCFFHYINLIHEVDECDLLTDVYVPIK